MCSQQKVGCPLNTGLPLQWPSRVYGIYICTRAELGHNSHTRKPTLLVYNSVGWVLVYSWTYATITTISFLDIFIISFPASPRSWQPPIHLVSRALPPGHFM